MTRGDQLIPRAMPETRWTLIGRAGMGDERALDEVLTNYRPALLTHILGKFRLDAHRAEDFLQDFVHDKILRKQLLTHAQQSKGRFRTFLLTSLDNYVKSEFRKLAAAKERPNQPDVDPIEIDFHASSPPDAHEGDRAWAKLVLEQALEQARQQCERAGQGHFWKMFEYRVTGRLLDGAKPPPYEQIVRQLGFKSPMEASNALVTAKRRFVGALEDIVATYCPNKNEVEHELAQLREILAG